MSEEIKTTLGRLPGQLKRKMRDLQERADKAIVRTAQDGVAAIKTTAPKAFGDLQNSVHLVRGPVNRVVVDAPHAGAVEIGSPPHKPDIEKLTAWVKLRGMQGLRRIRSARLHGPTTAGHAKSVKALLAAQVQKGEGGDFSSVDAPRQVALAIAKAIEKEGTKPHFFVRNALPQIAMQLSRNMRKAIK